MPRRKNATRKDGRISVQVYIGRDESGKRKYKTAYGYTQSQADAKAQEIKIALGKGLDVMAASETFEDWAEHWIKIKSTEVADSQKNVYKSVIEHVKRYIGKFPITKIRTADIQEIILAYAEENPNTKKPASKKMLETIKGTISQVYELAIQNRVTDFNPATYVKIPNMYKPMQRRALTAGEQQWIIDSDDSHNAKRAAMIMMYSGLRRGELIPLTWSDIDLENGTIDVNKSAVARNNKFTIKPGGKTDASTRTIDIPDRLTEYLKGEKVSSIYVCVNANGKMHTPSSWKKMWESYLADLNIKYGDFSPFEKKPKSKFDPSGVPFVIPRITGHWLRHTFATMLYLAGVDVLTAKSQLGHRDIKTTLGIYTHLDSMHKRKSMSKLNEYLDLPEDDKKDMQVRCKSE